MNKHTPGPWQEYNQIGNRILNSWRVGSISHSPAGVCRLDESLTGEEALANAHLIAAAPDLLGELLAVKAWMEDCLLDRQEKGLPSRVRYDAVCAAIAKARGETA